MINDDEIEEQIHQEDKYDKYRAFAAATFYVGLFCGGIYYLTR